MNGEKYRPNAEQLSDIDISKIRIKELEEFLKIAEEGKVSLSSQCDYLEEKNKKLREGLGWFFDRYIALAESGDCGNWNPYDEKEVREAANLLKEQGK